MKQQEIDFLEGQLKDTKDEAVKTEDKIKRLTEDFTQTIEHLKAEF